MDNFQKLHNQVAARLFGAMVAIGALTALVWWLAAYKFELPAIEAALLGAVIILSGSILVAGVMAKMVLEPLRLLCQAIIYVDPDHHGSNAPNLDNIKLGRELVTNLSLQVYQFASQQDSKDLINHRKEIIQASNIVAHLPLPMFVFNKDVIVVNASEAALSYCGVESAQLFGKPLFDNLDLAFPSEFTLEKWIEQCQQNKVTHTGYWERVRVKAKDGSDLRQCDVSAFYNRENTAGTEYIVTLFDRTEQYNLDDESMSFVALAVHELRTPLTVLRGYIEVFQEELGGQLNDELRTFMYKMEASANQLTNFVHNILNVARIDGNQLVLHLNEDNWQETLTTGLSDMELRAKVYDMKITYEIDKNLPTVGIDKVSIIETLNNLVDNALKYSAGKSKEIIIRARVNNDGMVETTIQDFGTGIPTSVLPNLFEKFYRNHRTRAQIGGTGLGLYLSKAIINAHGGQIWADSKEGEGSTFGFTLVPYSKLAEEQKTGNNSDITRQAHGWIKNHSYYRR